MALEDCRERLVPKITYYYYVLDILSDQNLWLNFRGGVQQWRQGLAIGPA